jgi:hypothetical protein
MNERWGKETIIHRQIETPGGPIALSMTVGSAGLRQLPHVVDEDGNFQPGGTVIEYRNDRGELTERIIRPPMVKLIWETT